MATKTKLRIKAVFPGRRTRPVTGIPLCELERAAREAEALLWFNGSDLVAKVSARELLRRLRRMPEGAEVVVMFGSGRLRRARPASTSYSEAPGLLCLYTTQMT